MNLNNSLYPILYGCVTFSAGDLLSQGLAHLQRQRAIDKGSDRTSFEYDSDRTGRALLIGATSALPTHYYFLFLSTLWRSQPRVRSILYKVCLNTVTLGPVLNSYFFAMQSLLSSTSSQPWPQRFQAAGQRVFEKTPRACLDGLLFWPTATAINLALIPPQFQYIPQGLSGVIWQMVLSTKNASFPTPQKEGVVSGQNASVATPQKQDVVSGP